MTIRYIVSVASLVGLTACGGGGGTLGGTSFAELDGLYDSLGAVITIPTTTALPPGGTAAYTGFMMIGEDLVPGGDPGAASTAYLGKATIQVTFGTGIVKGSAGDFYNVDLNTTTGEPTSSNEYVGGSATFVTAGAPTPLFNVTLSGTIDGKTLDGTADGSFRGDTASAITIFDTTDGDVTLGPDDYNVIIIAN